MSLIEMIPEKDRKEIRKALFASDEYFDAAIAACVKALCTFRDDSAGFDAIHDRAHTRHVFDKGIIFNARQETAAIARVLKDYAATNIGPTGLICSQVERLEKVSQQLTNMIELWKTR